MPKGKQSAHLGVLSHAEVYDAIRRMSERQRFFAAALLRSRQPIPEQPLSRSDVLDALEMALSVPPERMPQELANLSPTYHAETRLSYGQYQTAKGWMD